MFILAHLSDPHIGPLPRPRPADLFSKRLLGYLNWRRRRSHLHRPEVLDALTRDLAGEPHDHTVVTGDLVNIALPGEFALARTWLERLGPPAEVSFVPGNHDAYVRAALPCWDQHWAAFMQGDTEGRAEPETARFPFVRRRGQLALIGLSSAVPTLPLLATGRIGPDQLARMAERLRKLGEEGLFRVVLIHHPPRSDSTHNRLVDAAPFRDTIAQVGCELVLHGHAHRHALTWLDGPGRPVPVLGVPSASAAPGGRHEPAGYNLYRIAGEAGKWSCEVVSRAIRSSDGGFGETGRRSLLARIPR